MASLQRRRGLKAQFFWPTQTTDRRGNKVLDPLGDSIEARVSESFDRANRAEVPGQQSVEQIDVIAPVHITAPLWSVVKYRGEWWDVTSAPARRNGRRVKHLTVNLRHRPDRPRGLNG